MSSSTHTGVFRKMNGPPHNGMEKCYYASKDRGTYVRGIGVNGEMWKVVSLIINDRIKTNIRIHRCTHGFRTQRGTATAVIELKLASTLSKQHHAPLYTVFLDLKSLRLCGQKRIIRCTTMLRFWPAHLEGSRGHME